MMFDLITQLFLLFFFLFLGLCLIFFLLSLSLCLSTLLSLVLFSSTIDNCLSPFFEEIVHPGGEIALFQFFVPPPFRFF